MEHSRSPLHVTHSGKSYSAVKHHTEDISLVAEHSSSSSPSILLLLSEDLSHSDSLSTSSSTTGVTSVRNSSGTTV